MPLIRPSRNEDLPAITALYAHHVLQGTGTFETEPPTLADMGARRADVAARGLPYLVIEEAGQVLGFAYCQWFKPRPAYRYSAENSVYVRADQVGRGVGRALMARLCSDAEAAGLRKLIAVIGDSDNAASIGLHRAAGFTPAGIIRACGWKFGRWLDIVLMEKALGEADRTPPETL